MDALTELYTNSQLAIFVLGILPLLMEAIKFLDSKMDSWSLADKLGKGDYKISLLNIIGIVLSFLGALVITLTGDFNVINLLAGTCIIYGSQYAMGKLGWSKVLTLLVKIKNKTVGVSDVLDTIKEVAKDVKDE